MIVNTETSFTGSLPSKQLIEKVKTIKMFKNLIFRLKASIVFLSNSVKLHFLNNYVFIFQINKNIRELQSLSMMTLPAPQ